MNHALKIVAVMALIVFSVLVAIQVTERTNLAEGFLLGFMILAIGSAIFVCYEMAKNVLDEIIEEKVQKN